MIVLCVFCNYPILLINVTIINCTIFIYPQFPNIPSKRQKTKTRDPKFNFVYLRPTIYSIVCNMHTPQTLPVTFGIKHMVQVVSCNVLYNNVRISKQRNKLQILFHYAVQLLFASCLCCSVPVWSLYFNLVRC